MMKKYLLLGFVFILAVFLLPIPFVSAHESIDDDNDSMMDDDDHEEREHMMAKKVMPMMNRSFMGAPNQLVINSTGEVKIHGGLIEEIESNMIDVKIWGLEFEVDASRVGVSGLNEGDQVMIVGRINADTGVVMAEMIKGPNSMQDNSVAQLQAKIQELIRRLEAMKAAGLKPTTNQ